MRRNIPGQLHESMLEVGENSYNNVNLREGLRFQVT